MNNIQRLQEMLATQNSLQQRLDPDWKTKSWDQDQAILVEGGELLTELGFKWWKHHVPDVDNVRIELVDIWHFMLNDILIHGNENDVLADLPDAIEHSYIMPSPATHKATCTVVKQFVATGLTGMWRIDLFLSICLAYDMPFERLHEIYMMKNTLNMFRWNNGYRSGTYEKDWNGREDNAVLVELRAEYPNASFSELYSILEHHYRNHVVKGKLLP